MWRAVICTDAVTARPSKVAFTVRGSRKPSGSMTAVEQIWEIRIRLPIAERVRDLALFNLAIDSELRGCDLVRLRVRDVAHDEHVVSRATVLQQKTGQPVRFELTEQTREAIRAWITEKKLGATDLSFPSRNHRSGHLSTRQ